MFKHLESAYNLLKPTLTLSPPEVATVAGSVAMNYPWRGVDFLAADTLGGIGGLRLSKSVLENYYKSPISKIPLSARMKLGIPAALLGVLAGDILASKLGATRNVQL